jgi:outer membrane immunogenic protein
LRRKTAHSSSGVVPGWTVGAGLEYAMTHNLTFKTEYLYTELGSWDHYWNNDPGYYTSTKLSFHTVRAGLNWKFDWFGPPVFSPSG